MTKRTFALITLLLCLLGSLRAQEAKQHSIHHYSSVDGLSQNTVMAILQDADGFMWFGTWDGLNRFDGHDFKTYKPAVSGSHIAQNRVDYLYEDSLHFIWINTYDGAFYRLNKHTDNILATDIREVRFDRRQADQPKILEQRKGVIWLAGDKQLLRVLERTGQYSDDTDRRSYTLDGGINCLIADDEECVWAGTEAGLTRIGDTGQKTFKPGVSNEENRITTAVRQGGNIWFGTESGVIWRCNAEKEQFERARLNLHSAIHCITPVQDRFLAICTEDDGFVLYDIRTGLSFRYSTGTCKELHSNRFFTAYVDKLGHIWLINEEPGVVHYIPRTEHLERLLSPVDSRYKNLQDYNRLFLEDRAGNLWVNAYGGGFARYNREENRLETPYSGISNIVHTAYLDNRSNLWVGSFDYGVDCISEKEQNFRMYDLHKEGDEAAEVRAIIQLRSGNVLAASKEGVVRRYSSEGKLLEKQNCGRRVYTMLEEANGNVLYGTKGNGIFTLDGKRIEEIRHTDDPYSLLSDNIYDLAFGVDSSLYVATYGGGVNICRNGRFIHQGNDWKNYPDFGLRVRQLCFVNDTILWAATTNGLLRINTRTLQTQETPYFDVRALCKTPDGHMWIGSFGGGLIEVFDPQLSDVLSPANTRFYTTDQGLGSDIVLSIVGDDNGMVWVIDENSISYLDCESHHFQHYDALHAEDKALFGEAKGSLILNGSLVFGCSNGFCAFSTDRVFEQADGPDIRFTGFLVMNQPAEIGGPIKDNICYCPEIRLKHSESVFTIEYAAIDYAAPERILYAYRLEGIDKGWNYVQHERRVTYSKLPAGDYTFHVRSTNANGIWCDNEQTIKIHVAPSFWATPWAFMIYFLVLLIIIYSAYSSISTASALRQEMEVEQKVTDIKLRFFTNISHELRTPLTLITGPVETVLRSGEISPNVRTQLEIVQSNASRMLRLINSILDFRKIQNNQMQLRIQHADVASLAELTFGNFRKEAVDKHIEFRFENEMTDRMAWVDKEKLDTIIYNLLSNAFKFTPAGKSITLRTKETPDYIIIEVSDTGIGIPQEKRSVLFQRFASHNEINASEEKTGTGIGLNLVKEMVDLQKGNIEVISEVGQGTTFSVQLLRDKEHFGPDAITIVDDRQAAEAEPQEETEAPVQEEMSEKKNLLAVDDNTDMRTFLHSILADDYNIFTAGDGQEAFAIAKQHDFDLIITDLMMPNVDGLELTEMLKSDMSTSHVPVILLTAKSAIESRLQALEYGADDYITKPFSPEYLLARIDNIIRQRERLQATYRNTLMKPEEPAAPEEPKQLSPNEIFLQKLYQFMVDNMDNNELSVDDLVKEMALGRTVFFNKLKGLTGLSPVEYIRDVRIKHAAQLLLDGQYNITEVTYMVGMNDSRYFAKCFKQAYGLTPTEYIRQHAKQ